MINSILSSAHHYYVTFFDSMYLKNVAKLPSFFPNNPEVENILITPRSKQKVIHMQTEIAWCYGSESLLKQNLSTRRRKTPHYWYDFYLGPIHPDKQLYFLCYPYSQLGKYVQENLESASLKPRFHVADVNSLLIHMQGRSRKGISYTEQKGLLVDVTKYTAEVKNEANADAVSLIGSNPLNSTIFEVLTEDERFSVETQALKLKCNMEKVGDIEMSFDSLGNFRFYLRKNSQGIMLPMLEYLFSFLFETKSTKIRSFLSKKTLLGDESIRP